MSIKQTVKKQEKQSKDGEVEEMKAKITPESVQIFIRDDSQIL